MVSDGEVGTGVGDTEIEGDEVDSGTLTTTEGGGVATAVLDWEETTAKVAAGVAKVVVDVAALVDLRCSGTVAGGRGCRTVRCGDTLGVADRRPTGRFEIAVSEFSSAASASTPVAFAAGGGKVGGGEGVGAKPGRGAVYVMNEPPRPLRLWPTEPVLFVAGTARLDWPPAGVLPEPGLSGGGCWSPAEGLKPNSEVSTTPRITCRDTHQTPAKVG